MQAASKAQLLALLEAHRTGEREVLQELYRRGICGCGGALRKLASGEQPRPWTGVMTGPAVMVTLPPPNTQCDGCGSFTGGGLSACAGGG